MNPLSYELEVFVKAQGHTNLSTAAQNIGLSQSQLSRIVRRLEEQMGVVLLDRRSKRMSGWTEAAKTLAQLSQQTQRSFAEHLHELMDTKAVLDLRTVTLEGLTDLALDFTFFMAQSLHLQTAFVEVMDLSQLEDSLDRGQFDFAVTFREPGHRKFDLVKKLGEQKMEMVRKPGAYRVLSDYEFASKRHTVTPDRRLAIVSNSLKVRERWVQRYGGEGRFPGEIFVKRSRSESRRRTTPDQDMDVLLLGQHRIVRILQTAAEFEP